MNYSNEFSLKAAFGDTEAAGLMQDSPGIESEVRLDKAAKAAMDEINSYLRAGGYILPLTFTAFTEDDIGDLNGMIQSISDVFTAFTLAASTDLSKQVYIDRRAEGLALLERIRNGDLILELDKTTDPTGAGDAVTVSRPKVFVQDQKTAAQIVRTYPRSRFN